MILLLGSNERLDHMEEKKSILASVRHAIGLGDEQTFFDADLIMHINSVFDILHQLGAGPVDGYAIEDDSETWDDYFGERKTIQFIKSYMYISVKLLFDPPQNSFLVKALEDKQKEYEWRINTAAESIFWKREVSE